MLPVLTRAFMLAKKAKDAAPRKLSSSEKEPGKFTKDELDRLREGDPNIFVPRLRSNVDKAEINPAYAKQMNRAREKLDKANPDVDTKLMRNEKLPFGVNPRQQERYKKGGSVKAAASRIKSSASRRADGAAKRGKTKGRTL